MDLQYQLITLASARMDRKIYPRILLDSGHLLASSDLAQANLPLIEARWVKRSVFLWYDHLAVIFVPSVGYVIGHIKTLTKFTQQSLNDSN